MITLYGDHVIKLDSGPRNERRAAVLGGSQVMKFEQIQVKEPPCEQVDTTENITLRHSVDICHNICLIKYGV